MTRALRASTPVGVCPTWQSGDVASAVDAARRAAPFGDAARQAAGLGDAAEPALTTVG